MLLGIRQLDAMYAALRARPADQPFMDRLLEHLEVNCNVAPRDLEAIPKTGACVAVSNHPFGMLEGAALASVIGRIRPDVRLLANGMLSRVPELRGQLITVDPMGGTEATRGNPRGLRAALDFLSKGGLLIVFPAGEVSHFQWRSRAIEDSDWQPSIARLLRLLRRRGVECPIVPAFIEGQNSMLFQAAGLIHPKLRTALLVRELLNKRRCQVAIHFGRAIAAARLEELATDEERIDYLRWRTYLLAGRRNGAPRRRRTLVPIAPAADHGALAQDVGALTPLAAAGELHVYCAGAAELPHVLPEIARLREITFRAAGEGTGQARDQDRFDQTYLHLFVWNAAKQEVVGAYRLAGSDCTPELYTQTLFHFGPELLGKLGPALELGRSFVRAEYQRSFNALLLLWRGIGEFVSRNPRYRVLFGPVSISGQYRDASRQLIASFLERHAWWEELGSLVRAHHPLRLTQAPLPEAVRDFEEVAELVADLEPAQTGVPVLLRQYLKLGGRLLGFNVDPDFAHALDGLIVVDLLATERRLLRRYLGEEAAARVLDHWKGHIPHANAA